MSTPVFSASELTKSELQAKQRLVIVASSLGTIFEWYDFYLYASLGRLFCRPVFSPRESGHSNADQFRDVRRGLRCSTIWSSLLWTDRRFGRPEIYLFDHDHRDGSFDGAGRSVANLLPRLVGWHRLFCFCCGSPKAWRWAANMEVPRPMSLNMPLRANAASLPAGFKPRPLWVSFSRWLSFGLAGILLSADAFKSLGLANPIPAFCDSARDLHLHSTETPGIASLPGNEGAGQGIESAAARQFPDDAERKVCLARAVRRDRRSGCRLVYRTVPCLVLPPECT